MIEEVDEHDFLLVVLLLQLLPESRCRGEILELAVRDDLL